MRCDQICPTACETHVEQSVEFVQCGIYLQENSLKKKTILMINIELHVTF